MDLRDSVNPYKTAYFLLLDVIDSNPLDLNYTNGYYINLPKKVELVSLFHCKVENVELSSNISQSFTSFPPSRAAILGLPIYRSDNKLKTVYDKSLKKIKLYE